MIGALQVRSLNREKGTRIRLASALPIFDASAFCSPSIFSFSYLQSFAFSCILLMHLLAFLINGGCSLPCNTRLCVTIPSHLNHIIVIIVIINVTQSSTRTGRLGPVPVAQRAVAAPGLGRGPQGERAHQQHGPRRQCFGRRPAVVPHWHPHSKPCLRALRPGALPAARPVCLLRVPQQGLHVQETRLAVWGPGCVLHRLRAFPDAARGVLQPANLEPDCEMRLRGRGGASHAQTPSGGKYRE